MKKDKQERKSRSAWIDVVVLGVLVTLGSWTYQQLFLNYRNMETSQQMLQSLLTHQTDLTREYRQDLILVQERLEQAELSLNTVYTDLNRTQGKLSKAQTENDTLHRRIQLLNSVADLEGAIFRLKEKNALLINHISSVKRESFPRAENIKTLRQGRSLIAKYHGRLRVIKKRIRALRHKERLKRIAAQKERDRIMLLAGNNGYLLRNGRLSPTRIVLPVSDEDIKGVPPATRIGSRRLSAGKDVKIEVTFVK